MHRPVKRITPYLMALLASRIGSISIQMNSIMVKSARSSLMALARDCSTPICDGHGDVSTFPPGFPVHVGETSLAGHSLLDLNGDRLRSSDAYLNNSSYHRITHVADHTILVPVFYENELLFICVRRGHQADVGNSIPTTYYAKARDVYGREPLFFRVLKLKKDTKTLRISSGCVG